MNTASDWDRVKSLFQACLELDAAARASRLDRECVDAPHLRIEVESLLKSADQAGAFLEQPAAEQALAAIKRVDWIGRRLGAYEIVALLAAGGMGEVYRAVRADDQYRQEVAIKLMRRGMQGAVTLSRFKAERQILASLDHPNIARLLDAGLTDDSQPFFVMQLIDGVPIDEYCDDQRLSVVQRLELFCEVCAAVQYAHQHLVVHRDLKPANILVAKDGAPRLLDFGIAKVLDAEPGAPATVTAMWAMTPEYSSPEQVRGEPITTATDVYSLGVILYRLLTGRSPYLATQTEPFELAKEVCDTQPVRPSTVAAPRGSLPTRKQLEGDLDSIVLMAMRKEPQRRYASVAQLAQDIRRHLQGLPVSAARDSLRYRAGKFVQRHRTAVIASAAVLVALTIGINAIITESRVARAERQRADRRFDDVRQLANALIFDLHDAIEPLPGSTTARKLLVEKALKYLDTLAKESSGDWALQRELAAGYFKLGQIQGNPYYASLGQTMAARESFTKALSIRKSVAAANPHSDEDLLALAQSLDWEGAFAIGAQGDLQNGLQSSLQALAILEPLLKASPGNKTIANRLTKAYETIGDIQAGTGSSANLANVDAGVEFYRKAQLLAKQDLEVATPGQADVTDKDWTIVLSVKIGESLVKKGERLAALAQYRQTLEVLLSKGSNSGSPLGYASYIHQRIGNVHMMDGDSHAAVPHYRASLEISRQIAAADPRDAVARIDLAVALGFFGYTLAVSGDKIAGLDMLTQGISRLNDEVMYDSGSFGARILALLYVLRGELLVKGSSKDSAIADYRRAAAIFATAASHDPQAQISLAATHVKIADALQEQGKDTAARTLYDAAITRIAPFTKAEHTSVEALYTVADAQSGIARLLLRRGSDDTLARPQRLAALRECHSHLEQSAAVWRQIPNPGRINPSGFEALGPGVVAELLGRCSAL